MTSVNYLVLSFNTAFLPTRTVRPSLEQTFSFYRTPDTILHTTLLVNTGLSRSLSNFSLLRWLYSSKKSIS